MKMDFKKNTSFKFNSLFLTILLFFAILSPLQAQVQTDKDKCNTKCSAEYSKCVSKCKNDNKCTQICSDKISKCRKVCK